ncbi:MAG: DUF5615 family PIN-like protein [Bacteroidota bacterium]
MFDNNLSPFLPQLLRKDFPDSLHCADVQLDRSDDLIIWNYAKDSDFNILVTIFGFPPHIVWIRRANCSTKEIEQLLHASKALIQSFIQQNHNGLLILL